MEERRIHLIIAFAAVLLPTSWAWAKASPYALHERRGFAPGVTVAAEGGGVLLAGERTELTFAVQGIGKDRPCALMFRCKAVGHGTFNWLEVRVNGRVAGNLFPCVAKSSNMKALAAPRQAGQTIVSLTLREGSGCIVDSLRFYDAALAWRITKLHPDDAKGDAAPPPFKPDAAFRRYAVTSARWLRGERKGSMSGVRGMVKRTAGWGKNPTVFQMMIGRYIELLETPELLRHAISETGFESAHPMNRWDEIESDPAFSDLWRLEIVNTFFHMMRVTFVDWSGYNVGRFYRGMRAKYPEMQEWKTFKVSRNPYAFYREEMVRPLFPIMRRLNRRRLYFAHNHMMWPAISLYWGARYFERYGLAEAKAWAECPRYTFEPMMRSSKPMEDCSGYQFYAMNLMVRYARATGDEAFFAKGGPFWRFVDLTITANNNMGDGPGFGDVGGYPSSVSLAGKLEGDVFDTVIGNYAKRYGEPIASALPAKRREDYLGIRVNPLEPMVYTYYMDGRPQKPVPEEQCFDKISFRRGFGRDDQYLLLDGMSFGYHGHADGNSILQFDDEGRTWLVERGYHTKGIRDADQHNMVVVSRPDVEKGKPSPLSALPTFSALVERREDSETGMTVTATRGYNGVDWTRTVFWAKEEYFVVIDELVALRDGPVTLTCVWRGLGDPQREGRRLCLRQRPKPGAKAADRRELSLVLINCDESTLSLTKGREPAATFARYPYAGPIVRVFRQERAASLKRGDRYVFLNVFGVTRGGQEQSLTARRVGERAVEVTLDGRPRVVGR